MPPEPPIGEREREILTAIVETFIATGDPVGSQPWCAPTGEGLSPATIRNVMADLADAGYLEQPHTSAGRVPSSEAYRYYVEQLTGKASICRKTRALLRIRWHGVSDVQEFMERTSHVLSLISHNVGITVAVGGPRNALEHPFRRLLRSPSPCDPIDCSSQRNVRRPGVRRHCWHARRVHTTFDAGGREACAQPLGSSSGCGVRSWAQAPSPASSDRIEAVQPRAGGFVMVQ